MLESTELEWPNVLNLLLKVETFKWILNLQMKNKKEIDEVTMV